MLPIRRCLRAVPPLLLAFGLAGCATPDSGARRRSPEDVPPGNPNIAEKSRSANGCAAAIRPGFLLDVRVEVQGKWEIVEASLRVSDQGEIRLPLVGSVEVAGQTLENLRPHLTRLFEEYFVNPRVSVEFGREDRPGVNPWGSVTVLGRVKNPGVIPLPPTRRLSVVAAIQAAGGFDTSASQGDIRITNAGANLRRIDLRQLGRPGAAAEDGELGDGDIVFVPERLF